MSPLKKIVSKNSDNIRKNIVRNEESLLLAERIRRDKVKDLDRFDKVYKGYMNWGLDSTVETCNSTYYHKLLSKSHNKHNWHNARDSELFAFQKLKQHKSLELFWTKKCHSCGAKYLNTHSEDYMKKCCKLYLSDIHILKPLLPSIQEIIEKDYEHICSYSNFYNNSLSFGSVSVSNNRKGGFENIVGNHAVTINGRTYHKTHGQKSSKISNGLGYMFFDHLDSEIDNAKLYKNIKSQHLKSILVDMKSNNHIAKDTFIIGKLYYIVLFQVIQLFM